PGNASQRYRAAADLARCVALAGDREAERKRYGDLALAELRAAVKAGFRDLEQLQTDEALAPLRDHADFPELEKALEAKGGGKRSWDPSPPATAACGLALRDPPGAPQKTEPPGGSRSAKPQAAAQGSSQFLTVPFSAPPCGPGRRTPWPRGW